MRLIEESTFLHTEPFGIGELYIFRTVNIFKRNHKVDSRGTDRRLRVNLNLKVGVEREGESRRIYLENFVIFAAYREVKRIVCRFVQETCLKHPLACANTEEIPRF